MPSSNSLLKAQGKSFANLMMSAALGCSLATPAGALPIFGESVGQRSTEALTLYPDSSDPSLFYFMPNSSTFAIDRPSGLPAFGFTYWGLTNGGPVSEAGAYLTFTLRLISDASQKAALEDFLKKNPNKGIAVLPVQSSTVGLASTNSDGRPLERLFEEFNFSRVGGRAEDEMGVNAVMTGVGARVFRAGIENPQLMKIDYCYKVAGLTPEFNASIDVDWAHTYHEFELQASANGFFTSKSIGTTVERLWKDGHVKFKVNGGDAKDQDYINSIRDAIVARLFKPDLSDTPGVKPTKEWWSFTKLSLNYTDRAELHQEHWELTRRRDVTQEFCVPMRISEIAPYKNKLIQNADAAY